MYTGKHQHRQRNRLQNTVVVAACIYVIGKKRSQPLHHGNGHQRRKAQRLGHTTTHATQPAVVGRWLECRLRAAIGLHAGKHGIGNLADAAVFVDILHRHGGKAGIGPQLRYQARSKQ